MSSQLSVLFSNNFMCEILNDKFEIPFLLTSKNFIKYFLVAYIPVKRALLKFMRYGLERLVYHEETRKKSFSNKKNRLKLSQENRKKVSCVHLGVIGYYSYG